ncbi:MAG: hypothetical protein F4Y16_10470 [Holophagales bacterium]|nr:hypothetical protein [Holophagales bacterium]MYH24436.1 hypothetical protein [Holophagales bacterium]
MAKALGPRSVVDTNVAVVAEGGSDYVSARCTEACEEALKALVEGGVIVVDEGGKIVEEYEKQLGHAPGGVGARFFKYVWNEQWRGEKVRQVAITEADDERGFEELPPNELDPSDRKFLAVAVVGQARILNAVDSDWSEQRCLTDDLSIDVVQLCPEHAEKAGG